MEKEEQLILIGVSGKIGVGKDYVMDRVIQQIVDLKGKEGMLKLAFADPIKEVCVSRHGTPFEKLYGKKDDITRQRLQAIGDEFRKEYGEDYYVNWMKHVIQLHSERSGIRRFYIPDVRFPEEIKMIHEMGGVIIRVNAPKRSREKLVQEFGEDEKAIAKITSHRSETLLDNCDAFDCVISNEKGDNLEFLFKFIHLLFNDHGSTET